MKKPTLYVGLDGPLLVPHHDYDPLLEAKIVPYAKPFMHWATQHYNCVFLTDREPGHVKYLLSQLGLPKDAVPLKGFGDSKARSLRKDENFYWVDSELIPHEVSWLAEHSNTHRFVPVNSLTGVTPEHKTALAAKTTRK